MKNLTKKENEYGYYSKLLNKPFDSLDELKEAEKKELAAREEKKKESESKKVEAHKVEDAFKAYNSAKANYSEKIQELRKNCAQKIASAKKEYSEKVNELEAELNKAAKKYSDELNEFTEKHPEGYHMTLKDGDNITTIEKSVLDTGLEDFYSLLLNFLEI